MAIKNLPYYFTSDSEHFFDKIDPLLIDYWNKKNIRYDFNEHMFRTSHDFSKLKNGEFILVIGCSHTVGVGIDYDSMYTSILEKELKFPVVNIASGSSDINMVLRNLSVWMKNFPKPKLLIIQIPDPARFSYIDENGKIVVVIPNFSARPNFENVERLGRQYHATLSAGHQQLNFLQTIVDGYNVDALYISVTKITEYNITKLQHPIISVDIFRFKDKIEDYKKQNPEMQRNARDGTHFGDLVNLIWADTLLDILRNRR